MIWMLRLFVEGADAAQAEALEARLRQALRPWALQREEPPRLYWKLPDCLEFTFTLRLASAEAARDLRDRFPGAWTGPGDEDDPSFVWNRSDRDVFAVAEVTWVELLAVRPRAHLSVLTLTVSDLARAVDFYRDGLGWPTKGIIGQEFAQGAVAFFDLQPGLRLALWPRASLAHDAGLALAPPAAPDQAPAVLLGHNLDSVAQVEALMVRAQAAGARIVRPAQPTFYGGHAGYFADPDGHLWEVVFNPGLAEL